MNDHHSNTINPLTAAAGLIFSGALLVAIISGIAFCSWQFILRWNRRSEYTRAKVYEANLNAEKEWQKKKLRQEEQIMADDQEYRNSDFRVPEKLQQEAKKSSGKTPGAKNYGLGEAKNARKFQGGNR